MHIGKEIIDCNYEIHRNLCSNRPSFGYAILLTIDLKMHNTKISQVPTLSSSIEGISIVSKDPKNNLEIEPKKFVAWE